MTGTGYDARWVKPDALHVTLKFLGETQEDSLSLIISRLKGIGQRFVPFKFNFKGLGYFPDKQKPRILRAGCTDNGRNTLVKLHGVVETSLQELIQKEALREVVGFYSRQIKIQILVEWKYPLFFDEK